MGEQDESRSRGFTVVDKRGAREPEPSPQAVPPPPKEEPPRAGELPTIDFSTFALSLGTSALYHMGLVEDPETGAKAEPNLVLARQTIDTLEMLQRKTAGNLEEEETRLLESLLYELRMRFVQSG